MVELCHYFSTVLTIRQVEKLKNFNIHIKEGDCNKDASLNIELNLQLTAPKETTPVNQTSTTGQQMTARRDNVISITLRQVYLMSIFLIRSGTFQSSSFIIILTKLGRPLPDLIYFQNFGCPGNRTRNLNVSSMTY